MTVILGHPKEEEELLLGVTRENHRVWISGSKTLSHNHQDRQEKAPEACTPSNAPHQVLLALGQLADTGRPSALSAGGHLCLPLGLSCPCRPPPPPQLPQVSEPPGRSEANVNKIRGKAGHCQSRPSGSVLLKVILAPESGETFWEAI